MPASKTAQRSRPGPKTSAPKKKSHQPQRKLMLIDGYSLAFRAFFALPDDLQTTDGTLTNAVYGFTAMLIKLLQEEKPDYIACCLDSGRKAERTEEFSDYKSNRSETPETFSSQVPFIVEVLKVLQIPTFAIEGQEADDIIAYLAKCAPKEGVDVLIVTGDRDFFQLVDSHIHVMYNRRGITDIVEMDPKAVEERYGVPPSKYVDLKALEGDTSDNLPGVPGVGTKTAAKLVQKYGSAEAAVEHASEQTPKLAENLAAHAEQVAINKRLSILQEVPLEVDIDELKLGVWDLDAIRELFISLEFRTLLERLMADLPEAAEGEGEPFEVEVRTYSNPAQVKELATELEGREAVAIDLVTGTARGTPRSLAFSWGDGEVAYVPIGSDGLTPAEVVGAFGPTLSSIATSASVHGGRAALLALSALGLEVENIGLDTHIASYLLDPGAPGYAVDEIARKYTGRELKVAGAVETIEEAQATFDLEQDVEAQAEEASLRALAIAEIADAVEPELDRLGMSELYRTIEHPLIPVLARMEQFGVRVDLDYLEEMARELDKKIGALETECYDLAGEKVNLGSPSQLRILLYEKLGLKTTRRTKTGLSTDARALQQLVGQHPFVEKLLEYREYAKLKNTYVDALPPLVDPVDGRVHTTYDQTITTTGRLSSTNPNLMNIPIRTDLGRQIRRAFIPEDGYMLMSVDYSQIELRVMAHLSDDPTLIEIFEKGEDIHTATGARVFGVAAKDLTVKHRSSAKMINYGLAYGMGAPGLADRLNIARSEAEEIMDAYFEQFQGVADFLDNIVKKAHADGFTTTLFGRRRYLPELGSGNPRVRAIGERQALNAPIQGTAADIMKLAMINVDRGLREQGIDTRMILTVHDELVFEVPTAEKKIAGDLVKRAMTSVIDMKVPLAVDLSFGENWAAAKA